MSFLVKKTFNNGYRCCCHTTWEKESWIDDRNEALAEVPRELYRTKNGDIELEEIEVIDGPLGRVIACGRLEWPAWKGYKYSVSYWHGFDDDGPFESVIGGNPGESWTALIGRLNKERIEEQKESLKMVQE